MNKKTGFRNDIEGLRAFAVLLVIFSHLNLGFKFLPGGYIGVDIFFVLSGFLITNLLLKEYLGNSLKHGGYGWISLKAFYFRRAKRILPSALVVLIVSSIASAQLYNSAKASNVYEEGIFAAFFLTNFYMIRQQTDYFQQGFIQSPFQHYWSLSVEEQYYLLVPSLFLIITSLHGLKVGKIQIRWHRRLLLLVLTISISSFLYALFLVENSPTSAYFSSFSRAWEIGAGGILAIVATNKPFIKNKFLTNLAALIAMASIVTGAFLFDDSSKFPGTNALLPVIATSILILTGINHSNFISKILSTSLAMFIGRISYSLYLWHLPILIFCRPLFPAGTALIIRESLLFSLIFVTASITYNYVEKPFRNLKVPDSFVKKSPTKKAVRHELRVTSRNGSRPTIFTLILMIIFAVGSLLVPLKSPPVSEWKRAIKPPLVAESLSPTITAKTETGSKIKKIIEKELPSRNSGGVANLSRVELENRHLQYMSLLSSSLNSRNLISELVPSLSELASRKGFQPQLCSKNFCEFGKGPRVITIIGNSFAQMLQPVVTEALSLNDYTIKLQWKVGCQIAEMEMKICSNIFNVTSDTDLVILSEYSFGREGVSMTDIARGLETNYRKIKELQIPVLVIGEPVFSNSTLLDCVDASNRLTGSCENKASSVAVKNAMKKDLAISNGFSFIDPNDWICLQDRCPLVIDKHAVFVDKQHFSYEFSKEYLAIEFRRDISNMNIF